jgi:hypothetical protein
VRMLQADHSRASWNPVILRCLSLRAEHLRVPENR